MAPYSLTGREAWLARRSGAEVLKHRADRVDKVRRRHRPAVLRKRGGVGGNPGGDRSAMRSFQQFRDLAWGFGGLMRGSDDLTGCFE